MTWLDRYGYSLNIISVLLWPLSWVFALTVRLRRWLYRYGFLRQEVLTIPLIVVGNITVGGTGKTPLIIRLVELLREAGYRPGIISRGYGGKSKKWPRPVTSTSDPSEVGDEPLLLAQRCRCPIVVGPDRVEAARTLLASYQCTVLLSDDGLQHYAMARDIEIAVIDGVRRLGNGVCLPAGPLREPPGRLDEVDFVVSNGFACGSEYLMTLRGKRVFNLSDPYVTASLSGFRQRIVHAVAGIGHPQRFFDTLRRAGLQIIPHPFPDHHVFRPDDLRFRSHVPVLMTEKDAVKCRRFAKEHFWCVPVTAHLDPAFEKALLKRLMRVALDKGTQRGRYIGEDRRSRPRARYTPPRPKETKDHGQETPRAAGMPSEQSPIDLRQGPSNADLCPEPVNLSDSGRHSRAFGDGSSSTR